MTQSVDRPFRRRNAWPAAWAAGALLLLGSHAPLVGQAPPAAKAAAGNPAAEGELDEASKQAAQLEAELGKLKEATPEAAEVMLKLTNLYHEHGRALGLVRVAQRFTAVHSAHPKHAEVMRKLLDGLAISSRNSEYVAAARQFLSRYPNDPACGDVELELARTLLQSNDRRGAAMAFRAVWNRRGNTLEGKQCGATACWLFDQLNAQDAFILGAETAEAMHDKLPAGSFAALSGRQALYLWQRANDWARANQAGKKLLEKHPQQAAEQLRDVHYQMGENYARLNQRTNAFEAFGKARAIREDVNVVNRIVQEWWYGGAAKPEEAEGLIREFAQKHPDRPERWQFHIYLAHSYLRAGKKDQALQLFQEALPHDARTAEAAQHFVQQRAVDAASQAEAERVLLDALGKNKREAYAIRYALAFDLYRDRMQNVDKAKATARDLLQQSPADEGYTQSTLYWLLGNPKDDAEFDQLVPLAVELQKKNAWMQNLRTWSIGWAREARKNKQTEARGKKLQEAIEAVNQTPEVKDWFEADSQNRETAQNARKRLLEPGRFAQLPDEAAFRVAHGQMESYRHYNNNEYRAQALVPIRQLAQRFPKHYQAALWQLEVASDYAPPEVGKEASLHLLAIAPEWNHSDAWRRIFWTAEKLKDVDLLQKGMAWAEQSQQKFGPDLGNASSLGDVMERMGKKDEALAFWKKSYPLDRNSYESRGCIERLAQRLPPDQRRALLLEVLPADTDFHGSYALWLAQDHFRDRQWKEFTSVLTESRKRQDERPFRGWGPDEGSFRQMLDQVRSGKDPQGKEYTKEEILNVIDVVRAMRIPRASSTAELARQEIDPPAGQTPVARLLAYRRATQETEDSSHDWDLFMQYAQGTMVRKDYTASAALLTGMLANIGNVDPGRQQVGRERVAQCFARMGGVGLALDESSPLAPLLQAALYLRLGDQRLALEAYTANKKLFDEKKYDLPVDLILFVAESHIAAGGDENLDRAEEILRGWLIKFSESKEVEEPTKASLQLLLARTYFKGQRYDVARAEYQTLINRYPSTTQAIEADFGVGECFMAQKVFDQAEQIFTRLASRTDRETAIRAEFLRGVLANRRGDGDEARLIFRRVLDMVPSIELADQALYNLSEVYGSEQRYMDQLELLRTVGRLGRGSKRWHTPGMALTIVVQDGDLGISRGHAKIPVRITTHPGGDEELIHLYSGGAGQGLFRADVETQLGEPSKNDKVLQLTGKDVIRCDYPEAFKAEFKSVALADAEIRIAAAADFQTRSSKIVDEEKETLSQRLEREAREREAQERRLSQERPANQIKPGNPLYFRVKDADRDLTNEADVVLVKVRAASGDEVQVSLKETGAHSGVFEGSATTGELPAGALASDTSIDHSPLMAIDRDEKTAWRSEPDGAAPKWLAVDVKNLRSVAAVKIVSPKADDQNPLRGILLGSHDGRFWHRLGTVPAEPPAEPLPLPSAKMTRRVYAGNFTQLNQWKQVQDLVKNRQPSETTEVETLSWQRNPTADEGKPQPTGIVWHGKLMQAKTGGMRIHVGGNHTALWIDGRLELPLGPGNRHVDLWLERGTHELSIFSAVVGNQNSVEVQQARDDAHTEQLVLAPFSLRDFALPAGAEAAKPRVLVAGTVKENVWEFAFAPVDLRHVKLIATEYKGEALAINHIEIRGEDPAAKYIPTEADVLSLALNQVLELAAGDDCTASYLDEFTPAGGGRSQLLTTKLQATYFNGDATPIRYDFDRQPNGQVVETRKELIRIEPGERFIVEVVDYDLDQTSATDEARFQVRVNDGKPVDFVAKETEPFSGRFTKEVDTAAKEEKDKLLVKPGDRVTISYLDEQNTFPGHAVPRETVLYVNQPSPATVRVVETRLEALAANADPALRNAPPAVRYLPQDAKKELSQVVFEAPFTVEVLDPDQAKDSRSKVIVEVTTTSGAKAQVECVVSDAFAGGPRNPNDYRTREGLRRALEEGHFVGQIVMQLGGKDALDVVPLSPQMPRNLIGGGKLPEGTGKTGETMVTRVLNVGGQDRILAGYQDARRPADAKEKLEAPARLVSNGALVCLDRDFQKEVVQLHVGEKLFLQVKDADQDVSDARDRVLVEAVSERGEKESIPLVETLAHSGVFTGVVTLRAKEKPTPGDSKAEEPELECYFGDQLRIVYQDPLAGTPEGKLESKVEIPVVVGTDGLVMAFSKAFRDEKLAVETQFHIAESYFELFKSHKKLARDDEKRADLEAGRRVLREVMEDYPNPQYTPRVAYLLGQFAQELGQWDEAIDSYELIIRQFPDSPLAPDAQFKLAQAYEEAGDFDQALEAYVTLAATYPKSPLIANVMVRINEYFWKREEFDVAAEVGEKFLERFEGHQLASRMAFRIGQSHYKAKEYQKAGGAFDRFAKMFPDDPLCSDALFWAGESFRMGTNNREAFRRYNRCRWEHPESEAAKFARGRLALPAMLQQFEADANVE